MTKDYYYCNRIVAQRQKDDKHKECIHTECVNGQVNDYFQRDEELKKEISEPKGVKYAVTIPTLLIKTIITHTCNSS